MHRCQHQRTKKAGKSGRKSVKNGSYYFSAARGRNWYCSSPSRRYTYFFRATITRDMLIPGSTPPGLKVPLHNKIRSCGASRLPCTSVNRNVWRVSRMFRADENRMTWNYSRSILQLILSYLLCDYPIRAQLPFKSNAPKGAHVASRHLCIL